MTVADVLQSKDGSEFATWQAQYDRAKRDYDEAYQALHYAELYQVSERELARRQDTLNKMRSIWFSV